MLRWWPIARLAVNDQTIIVKIEFIIEDLDSPANEFIIIADPADKVPEITEINNKIKFSAAEYIKILELIYVRKLNKIVLISLCLKGSHLIS